MSELDKWFPRPQEEQKPDKEQQPDPGVIEGVKRPRQKQYARRWWQVKQEAKDERY